MTSTSAFVFQPLVNWRTLEFHCHHQTETHHSFSAVQTTQFLFPATRPVSSLERARLIKNAIICWNYLYLSQQLLEVETEEQKAELITAIKNGSVVSWRHINLHGEYDFSDEKLQDSVGLDLAKIITLKLA